MVQYIFRFLQHETLKFSFILMMRTTRSIKIVDHVVCF